MNQRLLGILGGKTERYPYELESKYPRILDTIMSLWDEDEIDQYFSELLLSDRSERSGFPPNVATEIMRLSLIHAAQKAAGNPAEIRDAHAASLVDFAPDPDADWADPVQHIKNELKNSGIPWTPDGFFEVAESGNLSAVTLFIEAKSNTEIRDNRGWTPLMMAAFKGHDEIVDLLIRHDADVNALDLGGNSALHWAAFGGHSACAKRLIEHHAAVNACNHFGWTPLIQASARNHPEIVALLIDSGVDPDLAADDGYSALHKAAASGYREIVKLLLDNGADRNLTTRDGDTAEKLAIKNHQQDIIELL